MKYLPCVALLCCVAGCGIFGSDDSSSKPAPAADPREAERAETRGKLNAKKQELAQVDGDLANISKEREQLSAKDASETKTNRLVELARLESDAKLKRGSITEDIAQYERQLGVSSGASAAPKPAKAGDALDDILASNDSKEKEDAERRKRKADDDTAADKARIAQAEAARKAELDERSKQKIEGGRLAQGAEGPAFEERWADVIQKVRTEIQRFKRW
jgi:hypothetical protein